MVVRYEDRKGVVIFWAAIAFEVFYQSVAGNRIQIGHVLEPSRKFQTKDVAFLEGNSTRQG